MTTETKVEAVAWLVTSGDARVICMSEATADAQAFELRKGGYPANIEKLIKASEITALEGEVADRKARHERTERDACMWASRAEAAEKRADAAERRVADFEKLLASARRAIGDHHAPNDCYATGPLTGDQFLDLVQCPACAFLDQYAALTKE